MIISIEGNIGSGKSTLIQYLKEADFDFVYLPEPVDRWNTIKDSSGCTILEKFYGDQKRYSFSFQMMAYITRLVELKQAMKENKIVITERCLYTDREIFAKMLYDEGLMEDIEYSIYLCWFDEFIKEVPIDGYIYLNVDPDTCIDRIKKRSRKGESSISLEYIKKLGMYHDTWLKDKPVLVLNDNLDFYEPIKQFVTRMLNSLN